MLTKTEYAALIASARDRGDDEEARTIAAEWNAICAERCASKERARQRTIARKLEAAWMAGVEAQDTDAQLPKNLTDYERRAWLAGSTGVEFVNVA